MKNLKNKMMSFVIRTKTALSNKKAEGFIDSGVKILIAVVIGALACRAVCPVWGHHSAHAD